MICFFTPGNKLPPPEGGSEIIGWFAGGHWQCPPAKQAFWKNARAQLILEDHIEPHIADCALAARQIEPPVSDHYAVLCHHNDIISSVSSQLYVNHPVKLRLWLNVLPRTFKLNEVV